ncbi:tetratricopeptide repeat protein [Halobacteriovorax sp. JY17]|uniref:tetratricopeptide repeat protein n=1 Tax=Halobacteriovorax sp. JY17 TaxID=2014617 RepID=UPI000C38DC7F|nr:tetratricopeptide repeat protein [Halobacteriovorax sp. JY17]PIK16711.1 MAG: hypothetical protein CES88_08175 [Halobacteriovorax sp. JY17]
MDISEIPFNMNIEIADDLREVPVDTDQMHRGINFLKEAASEESEELIKAKIFSHIGFYSRIVFELNQSHDFYEQSIALYEKHKKKLSAFSVKIRLAVTYQWMGKFAKADSFFHHALEVCRSSNEKKVQKFEVTILEYYGKCKFEQHSISKAEELLTDALEIRIISGDLELINQAQHALTIVTRRLAKD